MKVVAIIPAAGLGTRMASAPESKGKKPVASKQFTELRGTPILIHTLQKFAASPEVSEIYVALRKNEISGFQTRLEQDERTSCRRKHILSKAESIDSTPLPMQSRQFRRLPTISCSSTMRSGPLLPQRSSMT